MFTDFLTEVLQIQLYDHEVEVAHRVGMASESSQRLMVVRYKQDLTKRIFDNVKDLKGKKNADGKLCFIIRQIPDKWVEDKRQIQGRIKELKGDNAELSEQNRIKYTECCI